MEPPKFRRRRVPWLPAVLVTMGPSAGWAIQLPIQITPYVAEPGAPLIANQGGSTQTPPSGGSGYSGGVAGSSDALSLMEGQSWGQQAALAAQALGLNPSALAATCQIESGCNSGAVNGSAVGAFQMQPAAFQDGLNTALSADPALASEVVQGSAGMNDPVTEAIAASGYLMQANQALQAEGITNPTAVQARGYYNFGPTAGAQLALADPTETMAAAMPNVSSGTLSNNGITPGETVGQWEAAVSAKMGNAANAFIIG